MHLKRILHLTTYDIGEDNEVSLHPKSQATEAEQTANNNCSIPVPDLY